MLVAIRSKRWRIAREMMYQNSITRTGMGDRLPQHLNLGNQYLPPLQNANDQIIYQNIVNQRPIQPQPIAEQRQMPIINSQLDSRIAAPTQRQLPMDMSKHPYLINREESESLLSNDEESKRPSDENPYRTGIN